MKLILTLITVLLLAGCESFQYRGMSPNVRSFSEDPKLNQYYIGFDFEFNLVDPEETDQPQEGLSASPQFPEDPNVVPRPLPEPNIPW